MTTIALWRLLTLTLLVGTPVATTPLRAQEGDGVMDGTPRHGYYVTSRPQRPLSLYCGFRGSIPLPVLLFQQSADGHAWRQVGGCSSSTGRGPAAIPVGDATRHFIFPSPRDSAPSTGAGEHGRTMIINEASNDCGIRLRYSDAAGNQTRVVLLDPDMAFGHGVPITPLCDPLLDHYDHF